MPSSMQRFVVAKTSEIPDGGRLIVNVGGREIGVFNVRGRFYAMLHRCPHVGGPLCLGQVVPEVSASIPGEVRSDGSRMYVACPWHNWEFDIATGQSYWNPKGMKARPFPTAVETEGALEVAGSQATGERKPGPYQAETMPTSVEEEYVVVLVRAQPSAPSQDVSHASRSAGA